jgi:hypothetical protein
LILSVVGMLIVIVGAYLMSMPDTAKSN